MTSHLSHDCTVVSYSDTHEVGAGCQRVALYTRFTELEAEYPWSSSTLYGIEQNIKRYNTRNILDCDL